MSENLIVDSGHQGNCCGTTLTSSVVMTINQRVLVSALVLEYRRNTEGWLTERDINSIEALLDMLMVAPEVSHERCIEQGAAS